MNRDAPRPEAWNFLASRDFITSFDAWAAQHVRGYSRRAFAKWAGISSPNALTMVISGRRHFSKVWLPGFVRVAKLSPEEAEYLRLLVEWESASTREESERLMASIQNVVTRHGVRTLAGDRMTLLRHPLALTIYHMLDLSGDHESPKWFKARLLNKVPVPEIQDALDLLLRLGMIERGNKGYRALDVFLESPPQLRSAENAEFHRYALQEARQVLDGFDPSLRSFGSLTFTVAQAREADLKEEIARFGKMIQKKYGAGVDVEGNLFRLNIQLYPLTQTHVGLESE